MECPFCGASLPDDASFCPECGSPLHADAPASASGFHPDFASEKTASPDEDKTTVVSPAAAADPYTTPQTVTQSPAYSWREGEVSSDETVKLPQADAAPAADGVAAASAAPASAAGADDPLAGFGTTIEDAVTEPAFHADTAPLTEEEQLEQDRESLKTAKAEYKLARKRLGKSYAPAIALGVIAVFALCASTGWAAYSYAQEHPQNASQVQKLQKQLKTSDGKLKDAQDELKQAKSDLKDAKAELKAAKKSTDTGGTATDSSSSSDPTSTSTSSTGDTSKLNIDKPTTFTGTWRGALKETTGSWGKTCYGGSKNDLVITFKKIDESGQTTADISATLHAHDTYSMEGTTVDQSDGDGYKTYTDVTGTFTKGKGFEFDLPVEEDGCSLQVSGVPKKKNGRYYLDVKAVSGDSAVSMGTTITDKFELELS